MKSYYPKTSRNGFTLMEIMMTISLTAMVVGYIVYVFEAGLQTWIFGQVQAEIQADATAIMDQIIEGTDRFDGLREILDITLAEDDRMGYVPWWAQTVRYIDPEKRMKLELPYNALAGIPVAQVWDSKKDAYRFTEVNFFPGAGEQRDSFFAYTDVSLKGKQGRVFFYPSFIGNSKVAMTLFWDRDKEKIMRHYRGSLQPLIRTSPESLVSNFHIEYLDGTNTVIDILNAGNQKGVLNSINALRLFLTVSRGGESYTLRSFVNIRKKGIAGSGVSMTDGSVISIPNSAEVKTLSMISFTGVTENSKVYCSIFSPSQNKSYGIRVHLTLKNDIPWLESYELEYPKGKVVYSQSPDSPASNGINLLTVDYSGRYDYNTDEDIPGQVEFTGDDVIFRVEQCDVGAFHLMIR